MASELESFNARGDRQKEAVVLPTAEQLVDQERDAWQGFFGKEIDVPKPPQKLIQTLARLEVLGILQFEAHYLPKVTFEKDDEFPGWKVKPEELFWEQVKSGNVSKDATKLSGIWVLVDGRPKPNYQDGKQMYENDDLSPIIKVLRKEGRVKKYQYGPDNSRFGVSWDEIDKEISPVLAKTMGVSQKRVRVPREIEFNLIGNIHHPEWGETNTWEWFENKFGVGTGSRLLGGASDRGGLSHVYYSSWSGIHNDGIGFRPLVEFPQK